MSEGLEPGAAQQRARMLQICIRNPVAKHRIAPEFLLFGIATAMREDDGQCNLAIAEIVATVLAHSRAIGDIVDGIIHQLKRNAKIAAICIQRHFLCFAAFCDNSGYPARSSK